MDDMQSLYQHAMVNLAKSTAAVPLHLQGATGALAWWEGADSLLAKAEMPWDKKDEEAANAEDEEREEDDEEDDDEDEDEEDDEDEDDTAEDDKDMKKSHGDEMAALRQRNQDSMSGFLDNITAGKPRYVREAQRKTEEVVSKRASKDKKVWNARDREGIRGAYQGARDYDVNKSLDDLSAAADRLSSPMESDESPLLKSIAALNRLAGA